MLFGLGAVGGNFIGGYLSDRFGALRTLVLVCIAHMIMLPLFSVMPWNPWLLALLVKPLMLWLMRPTLMLTATGAAAL